MRKCAGQRRILRQRKNLCKGPEGGRSLASLQYRKRTSVAGKKRKGLVAIGEEGRETGGVHPQRPYEGVYSKGNGKALESFEQGTA
jgi:hypothetical protein